MPDTIRGNNPKMTCTDCGTKGTVITHWGPLAPEGRRIHCCPGCWTSREAYYKEHGVPKPVEERQAGATKAPTKVLKPQDLPSASGRVVSEVKDLPPLKKFPKGRRTP